MKKRKEAALSSFLEEQLLYNILLMNAFYEEIPAYAAQLEGKYRELAKYFSERNLHYYNELHAYWRFLGNFYKMST